VLAEIILCEVEEAETWANHGIYFVAFNNESLLQINLVYIKVVNNCMTYKCFTRLRYKQSRVRFELDVN